MRSRMTLALLALLGAAGVFFGPGACVTPSQIAAAPAVRFFQPVESGRDRASYVAKGAKAMIATAQPLATEAGYKILRDGGNAVDAAVAASFALGVVRPQSTGIGGGGFLVGYTAADKQVMVYDFRERAPAAATRDMYLDKAGNPADFHYNGKAVPNASVNGHLAVGVPGLVKGLLEMHARHGRLPLKQVMQPAIDLADNGFAVYPGLAKELQARSSILSHFPGSVAVFFRDGAPLKAGETLVQKDLAWTLRQIADHGADAFYKGEIAKRLVAEMRRGGGLVTAADLAAYRVKTRAPIAGTYRGYKVVSMPPPSSGGAHVIEIMNILAPDAYGRLGWGTVPSVHLLAEAMQRAFADRAEYLGDPDFVKVPLAGLISPAYGAALRRTIDMTKATPSSAVRPGRPMDYEHPETSHLSVVDPWGNAVSTTQTVNFGFGSCVVAQGTGIVLNDEMDDFSKKAGVPNAFGLVGRDANSIAANKTMLSSMSPTLVFDQAGKLKLVVGSPGGPRIISATLQTILNVVDFQMNLPDAVHATRIHHQWLPDELRVEKDGLDLEVAAALTKMGHKLSSKGSIGDVQAVELDDGRLTGVSDTRSEGKPMGF